MKRGLGKGLDALFADNEGESASGAVQVRLTEIEPNRMQPRKTFDQEALDELAESIRRYGVLQPLVVRPLRAQGGYQLVAGERRWRAARIAGLTEVPVIIRDLDDVEVTEIALIENLQREDLNPIEEAEGYRTLMDTFNLTQEDVSQRVGKSRSAVANALRLLSLPNEVVLLVRNGALSPGHARALLTVEDEKRRLGLARQATQSGCSVRELEKLAREAAQQPEEPAEEPRAQRAARSLSKSMVESEIEQALSEALGRKVTVNRRGAHGSLEIEFYDEDDLRALSNQLAGE